MNGLKFEEDDATYYFCFEFVCLNQLVKQVEDTYNITIDLDKTDYGVMRYGSADLWLTKGVSQQTCFIKVSKL